MAFLPRTAALAFAALCVAAPNATAQTDTRVPRIGYVFPAGGKQGTSFRVVAGGQFLDGVAAALVSGGGVTATVIEHVKPLSQQQVNKLREELRALIQKKASGQAVAWTAEDEKLVEEIKKKIEIFQKKSSSPAIVETVAIDVAVAAEAEPGERELRLTTALGLTNPLVFCIGQMPELEEREPAPVAARPPAAPAKGGKKANAGTAPAARAVGPAMQLTLPVLVNGRIMPGDVDRFRFRARKGERIVATVRARQLIPYLPDAVPGWFQATLALYDAAGRERAYVDDYRFSPDPILQQEIPADGEYVLEIKDAVYRGREDFVYRLGIGCLPFVTSVFPLGGRAGTDARLEVQGWNLPSPTLALSERQMQPGILPIDVRAKGVFSNRVQFAVDTLPESLEHEPNGTPEQAQGLELPVTVNGRIQTPDDRDVFRFEGRAGQAVVAEVYARRLGSPLDAILRLTDAGGTQLACNDDHEDKGTGLLTHHADSWLRATLPAGGTYVLALDDVQRKGGPDYAYRLRVGPPRPDFELRVVPSSVNARPGATVPLTVYALRRDGFDGDIALELRDTLPGFALSGAWVPGGQEVVRLTLTVPPAPSREPLRLQLAGRATIEGNDVQRLAVPADDVMQAFAYRHLVQAKELLCVTAGRSAPKYVLRFLDVVPVKIPAGGATRFAIGTPARKALDNVELALLDPPEGITLREAAASPRGFDITFASDAAKAVPGRKGNLILAGFAKKAAPKVTGRGVPVIVLPAVAFEIVAP